MSRKLRQSKSPRSKAASVGVRNLSLAVAGAAFNGVDLAARLYRLLHHGEARSIASNAHMLFGFWHHVEPFRQAQLAASFNRQWADAPALTTIAPSRFRSEAKTAACKSLNCFRVAGTALPAISV